LRNPSSPSGNTRIQPTTAPSFDSLEEAYRNHDLDVLSLLSSPELDPLRSDPRYLDLKKRTGLP
jgi:hypothetical protein